jgi:hypothetical protein
MDFIWFVLQEGVGKEKLISKELLKIWECDRLMIGGMATTESKFWDHVFAPGRQDKFQRELYNPVIRSADMLVAPSHYRFSSPP